MMRREEETMGTTQTNDETIEDAKESFYDFDIILDHVGQMGRYQALLAIFLLCSSIPIGMHAFSTIFLLGIPPHRCRIPGVDGNPKYVNLSKEQILNLSAPVISEKFDRCKMYDFNYSMCLDHASCPQIRANASIIPCHTFVYTENEFSDNVVHEWDLVCDRLIFATTLSSVYFAGATAGRLPCGNISDIVGRRYVLLISTIAMIGSGIGCAFASTITIFAAMRFIFAFTSSASFSVGYVYVTEILGQKWRDVVGPAYNASYAFGYTILSAMALYWRNWRELQLAITLCSAPFLLMCFAIPESPRWLFAKCRSDEAKKVIHLIAKRNGSPLADDVWTKSLRKSENNAGSKRNYSAVKLFQGSGIRQVTLIMMFVSFTVATTYFGLSLNVGALTGDIYLNNALSGVAEIVSAPIATIILRRHGRRLSTCMSMLLAGIMCIVSSILNEFFDSFAVRVLGTLLALCGKLAISTTYNIIFLYASELYPTVIRATAFSTSSTCALLASIITPYTLYLQNYFSWLPGIVFGTLSILAGLTSLRLKETRHQKMMTTLLEADRFYDA